MNSTIKTECLVFSTSLRDEHDLEQILEVLNDFPGILNWSVDLEDWEKVLRVECENIEPHRLQKKLRENGVFTRRMATS